MASTSQAFAESERGEDAEQFLGSRRESDDDQQQKADPGLWCYWATGRLSCRRPLKAGWPVRAFVRDTYSGNAASLQTAGAQLIRGAFADMDLILLAMNGVHGVFSVQLSSRQDLCGMSNEDEERFGIPTASLATENGAEHLV